MTGPELVGAIEIVASIVLLVTFMGTYHLVARWWESETGWHLMTFAGVLSLICLMLIGRVFLGVGNTCGIESWPEALVFAGFPGVLAWRLSILIRAQLVPGKEPHDEPQPR